jgi:hypothetical protein
MERQQQKDFQNAFSMNRVCSDVTDPVERSFGHWDDGNLFSSMEGDPRAITQLPVPTESEFSPPQLTRQSRSSGTRSFITKTTTHSNQTDDFDAWKMEEQHYWESLVAKEESTTTSTGYNKGDVKVVPLRSGSSNQDGRRGTVPPSPRVGKLRRVRDKVKRNFVKLGTVDHMMDAMIHENQVDMAEI